MVTNSLHEEFETLGEVFHSEYLAGHLRKVDQKKSGSLDRFAIVGWYVDEEVSLDSTEEPNHSPIAPRYNHDLVYPMLQFTLQFLMLLSVWICRPVFLSLDR